MIYKKTISSPLGNILLSSDGEALTGLWFEGQKYFAATLDAKEESTEKNLPIFEQVEDWLTIYFSGQEPDFMPPLSLPGTPFRQAVWDILLAIPYGTTVSYGDIARQLELKSNGKRVSARPVGGAVGHNPISLLVPCHRVIGGNGNLTGYAGGIDRKVELLKLEGFLGR